MNALTGPPAAAGVDHGMTALPLPPLEACPLCGSPLHAEQEWCLNCGAAARTRLAASPSWRAPIAAVLVVIALSVGVLAAALVKLAGDTGPGRVASTTTVTRPSAAVVPSSPQSTTPATSTPSITAPTSTTPSTATGLPTTGKAKTPATGAAPSGTTAPRTSSATSPTNGLSGVSKAIEERLRKQAQSGK